MTGSGEITSGKQLLYVNWRASWTAARLSFLTGCAAAQFSQSALSVAALALSSKMQVGRAFQAAGAMAMQRLIVIVLVLTTLVAAALISARTALAEPQHGGASLTGVVLGPNDKPVARAVITYQSSAGRAPHVVRTDAHGRFAIPKLVADNYDLRASANGIFSEWEKNLTLRSGETRSITLRLIYAKQMPKPGTITAGNVK